MKKKHRQFAILVVGCALVLFSLIFVVWYRKHIRSLPASRPVVFILPHQDDEMFMAGFIHRQVMAGRDVYVVLVTDGGASAARDAVNKRLRRRHEMALTRQQFAAARNREWFASIRSLGVPAWRISFANAGGFESTPTPRYPDNELTLNLTKEAVQTIRDRIGDGDYYTVAGELGDLNIIHGDHMALRRGLEETPGISYKGFFSEHPNEGTVIPLSDEEFAVKKESIAHYFIWNPPLGHYAVASMSVPDMLHFWEVSRNEYLLKSIQ